MLIYEWDSLKKYLFVRAFAISIEFFLKDHIDGPTCVGFDKKRFVTGGNDRIIYVYDLKEGRKLGKLEGHKGRIRCLQLYDNRLCSGSWDMTVIIWSMRRFEQIATLYYTHESVSCLYFDKNYLLV